MAGCRRRAGSTCPPPTPWKRSWLRRRAAAGHRVVGVKAGYANKAVWRALKLETLAWASMYEDTVALRRAAARPRSASAG